MGLLCNFQQYSSYILSVSFTGGGNLEYPEKTTDSHWQTLSQQFVSSTPRDLNSEL
jgi:hypothetical protein